MNCRSSNSLPFLTLLLLGVFIFSIGIKLNYTFIDEVYFADPVVNFLNGKGYTTSAWNVTNQYQTHVSSAPAYSFLLMLWLKIFGFSQTAVRTLPSVLALCAAIIFWRACLRSGLVKSGFAGLMLICLVTLDYGFAFAYTCGRSDPLSALVFSILFYLYTFQSRRALFAIGAVALLLPFVQWSCVIYLTLLSAALLFLLGRKFLKYALVVCFSMAAGLLIQKAAYSFFGIWDTWMATVSSEGSNSVVQRIIYRFSSSVFRTHSNSISKDFTSLILLAGMALVYLRGRLLRNTEEMTLAKAAWLIGFAIPVGMFLLGKFPSYYSWMVCFPLAAILCSYFEKLLPVNRPMTVFAASIALLACLSGLPMQTAFASYDWNSRKIQPVEDWLGPQIHSNDVVACDYPFYYIAKKRAKAVFVGRYSNKLTPEELSTVTLMVVNDEASDWRNYKDLLNDKLQVGAWSAKCGLFGNSWQFGFLSSPNYNCKVYRLRDPAPQHQVSRGNG